MKTIVSIGAYRELENKYKYIEGVIDERNQQVKHLESELAKSENKFQIAFTACDNKDRITLELEQRLAYAEEVIRDFIKQGLMQHQYKKAEVFLSGAK